jgi:hypothetical protein
MELWKGGRLELIPCKREMALLFIMAIKLVFDYLKLSL